MSRKHVVRRTSKNNRRKNTDGDRSDSGCFEDVDVLQMANRPGQTSGLPQTKSPPASDEEPNEKANQGIEKDRHRTSNDDVPFETPTHSDECTEDMEIHAILERLSEVTKNPGDLYRLCFSSRLSFCGLTLGGMDEEGSLLPLEETFQVNGTENRSELDSDAVSAGQSDTIVQHAETGVFIGGTVNEVAEHRNCGNREQCVELLSLLSSFVGKAKEGPAVFSQSGLGRSVLGQLSSLLTTLEEAKKNPNFSSSGVPPEHPKNPSLDNPQPRDENAECLMPERRTGSDSEKEPAMLLFGDSPDDASVASHGFHDVAESMSLIGHEYEEAPPPVRNEDDDVVLRVEGRDDAPAGKPGEQSGGVVTSGRRAVTPYSWDYGDIWEKELKRAQSSDSFPPERYGEPGSNMPGDPLMPTFEEIRDELFHDAGFALHERSGRPVGVKRRSRSADGRGSDLFRSEPSWPEGCDDQPAGHSPFVRTVYQHGFYPNSRLTRSGSSLVPGTRSMTINVDKHQGRHVRVFPKSPDATRSGQLDDSLALIVKEAVSGTSTFRGPKPWSMLKRRPSGLRRRSSSPARSEPMCPSEFQRTRLDSHGDSESSDSPNYVSAASSDCLTTDDSSSLTSSHYCAASSVQSSPTVSNRNSACFSDTGSSDVNDFRRVVFQDSSPELYHRDKYPWNNYTRDNNPRDKYPVNSAPSARERFFGNDSVRSRMDQWEGSLDQRFGRISRGSRAFSEPGENRLDIAAKNNLRKSYQRSDNYRGSDPSALRILQQNAVKKWTRDRARSPLVVRSDSDLNSLASVKFVGDSYSRSHISKNLHGARKASRSPSPGSAHTRVLSCEIMQSDKEKRDVYTKVNLSRPDDEEEETTIHDKAAPRLECNGTRQSWHGHLPQRGSPRAPHEEGGTPAPRRVHSERYPNSYSAGLVDRRRQVFRPQKSVQVDQPVRATLVEVKNVRANNIRPYHSTGSFRSSCDSDDSRHWSESRAPVFGRVARYDHSRQLPKNPLMSRGGSFGRAEVPPDQPANSDLRPIRRRIQTFRDQTSPTSSPSDSPEKREMARAVSPRQLFQNARTSIGTPENVRAKELAAPAKTESGSKGGSKEPVAHIVKETSFVGPATFTKYQSPSSPSSAHMHRSKSLNEKDSPSRRRAQESEACRKKALEMHSGPDTSPELPPSESGRGVVRRPERRRRNSEGSSRPSAVGDAFLGCVVDESYCDLRRESIREGTYSTVNAESARNSAKSPDRRIETAPGNDAESKRTPEEVPIPKTKNPVGIPAKENLEGKLQRSNMEQARKDRNEDDLRKHPLKDDVELERATVHLKEIKQMALLSCKVQSIGLNSIDKGDGNCATTRQPHSKDAEVSPVLRAEEVPAKSSHGVNVYIDYRSKRPVSVEYAVAESRAKDFNKASKVVLSKKDKATAKPSTKDKPAEAETQTPCVTRVVNPQPGLVGGVNHSSKDNEENESPRKRLSRKEKHVQEILSNFAQVYEKDKKLNEDFKILQEPSSPHPYRRDRTIVYTDARSSVDSDTDSISHHSTISSSGSDVTVILNDDTDISADGFKQLAQNNSEIGIELGSLEVEVGSDDFPDSPDSTPERNNSDAAEWVARLDGSVRRGDYAKPNFADLSRSSKEPSEIADLARATTETGKNRSLTSPAKATGASRSVAYSSKEAGENRNFSHPPNETEQGIKTAEPFKQGGKLRGIYLKYEQSVGEVQSTADQKNAESQSNASSPGCVQEIGASSSENTKGKHSSGKNSEGGKGLFSKLKSIRNSFRGKKSEGKSAEKSGRKSSKHSTKKAGKAPEPDIRKNLGSRSLPIFDNNSNEMHDGACEVSQRLADRTQSVDFSTRIASNEELAINHELSRMVNEPTKQKPSGSLRHAVGVKSLSSDQLNSGRVKRPSKKAAKSLEVLLETCI